MLNNRKNAVILGGLGLIGGSLAEELAKSFKVFVVDKRAPIDKIPDVKYFTEDALNHETLSGILEKLQPKLIVNAINIATIFSKDPEINFKKIISFYYNLYQIIERIEGKLSYIQMGTTGSGGLGFNIPFTHGDKIDNLPIINKAAFAGVSTAMLTLLSRSFGHRVSVSEIKPGLAIFRKEIVNKKCGNSNLVIIDGGESGFYTYNELALLTCYMGFTYVDTIVDKVKKILSGDKSFHNHCVYDTIGSLNGAIIRQNHIDQFQLTRALMTMKKCSSCDYIIATGKLGPPTITRDLILAFFKRKHGELIEEDFNKLITEDSCVADTLGYIKATEKPLYDFLSEELNYQNYLKTIASEDEPWKNLRKMIETDNMDTKNIHTPDL